MTTRGPHALEAVSVPELLSLMEGPANHLDVVANRDQYGALFFGPEEAICIWV